MKIALAFVCCLSAVPILAQRYESKYYGDRDGLPMTRITSLLEDRENGYLWVGSYAGVARFDGKDFETFTESEGLLNSIVTDLHQDSKNAIWIGTAKGVSKFDSGRFRNYPMRQVPISKITEFRDTIVTIHTSPSKNFSLIIVNDSILQPPVGFLPEGVIDAELAGQSLYIITKDYRLLRKDSLGTIEIKDFEENIFFIQINGSLGVISEGMYFRINGDSLVLADRTGRSMNKIMSPGEFFLTNFKDKFAGNFGKAELEILSEVPPTIQPSVFLQDSEGSFWIGTANDGLIKYYPISFEKLEDGDNSRTEILSFEEDNLNRIWVGSANKGLRIYKNEKLHKELIFDNAAKNRIRDISLDDRGHLWIATRDGVGKIDPTDFSTQWFFEGKVIKHVEFGFQNLLWIEFESGSLGYMKDQTFVEVADIKSLGGWAWDVKYWPEKGLMFVCTDTGRLLKFESESHFLNPDEILIPELKASIILSISFYGDFVLVATTGKGMALVNINSSSQVKYFSKNHGLSSDLITFIETDTKGKIWVGTLLGVDALRINNHGDVVSINHYGREDGLNTLTANAAIFSSGESFFGFKDGVYEYSASSLSKPISFPLHVEQISEARNGTLQSKIVQPLILSHEENSLVFSFKKVNKVGSGQVKYRYRLIEGQNETPFVPCDNRITLASLSPGKYQLAVQATDRDGQYTDESRFEFQIMPPFYQTIWFKFAMFVLLATIVTLLFYLRTKNEVRHALAIEQMRKEETNKIRKEIGQDFHDEMGNQLARIINYVSTLRFGTKSMDLEILEKTEHTAKYLLTGTKDFVWAIDPVNDNLQNLFVHIRDFGEKLLGEKSIEFRANYVLEDNPPLPHGYTRQINLIFKEAITNCFRHSKASKAELSFARKELGVEIMLSDDGVGFNDPSDADSLDGLSNMRRRAQKINGNIRIESVPKSGVKVILKIEV